MLNICPLRLDYVLGGGLTDTVPCVSIGSHVSPSPCPHAYKQPSWISLSASLLAAAKGVACLDDKNGERFTVEYFRRGPTADEFRREGAHSGGHWGDFARPGAMCYGRVGDVDGHHPWRWRGGPGTVCHRLVCRMDGRHPWRWYGHTLRWHRRPCDWSPEVELAEGWQSVLEEDAADGAGGR